MEPGRAFIHRLGRAALAISAVVAVAAAVGACSADEASEAASTTASATALSADVDAIVADLNRYWGEVDDELGFTYSPVPGDRVTTGIDGRLCDGVGIDPDELEGNAFVDPECDEGLTVAYDPDYIGDSLVRAEATLAHEWGHVVQAQAVDLDLSLSSEGLPIDAELQADCFAGAWAGEWARSDLGRLRADTAEVGDPDDVDLDDPEAHGTPEERVAAFDLGVEGGPVACVDDLVGLLPG